MDAYGRDIDMGFAIVSRLVVVVVVATVKVVVGLANVTVLHWVRKVMDHDEVRLPRSLVAGKQNLVFRGIDHCYCDRVGHSVGAHVVDLELLVKKRRMQLKVK